MLKLENITRNNQRAIEFFENKIAFSIGPFDLNGMLEGKNIQIIGVREKEDFDKSHIPNSISIPASELGNHLNKLSKDKINIVYCYTQQCHLAAKAALHLAQNNYPVLELEGGFHAWRDIYNYDVVS